VCCWVFRPPAVHALRKAAYGRIRSHPLASCHAADAQLAQADRGVMANPPFNVNNADKERLKG